MKRSACGWTIGILGLVVAGAAANARPAADRMPPELAITVAFGSAAARDRVRAYAERFSVGSGSVLADPILRQRLARVVGASSLDGLDPVYALVVDLDGPQIALLGTVVDAKALAAGAGAAQVAVEGRWAVVGSKQVLDRLGPYALGTIATQRAPTALTATVWFRQILARHKAALDGHLQLLTRGMSLLPGGLSGPFLGLLTQVATMMTETEKLTATLAVTPELASLDLSITPVPGSGFAKLLATARPSEFGLLDRLPERSFLRAAGRLSAASHRGPRNLIGEPVDAAADREPGIPIPDLFTDTTGDFAFSLSVAPRTGVTFMNLFGVVGTQAADRAIQERLARLESGTVVTAIGMSAKVKTRPITTTHDGVVIRGVDLTSDLSRAMSAMPQMSPALRYVLDAMVQNTNLRMQLATFDGLGIYVLGTDGLAVTARTIDATRGKRARTASSGLIARQLAAARARKDSLVAMLDIGAMAAAITGGALAPEFIATLCVGRSGHDAHVRVAVPPLHKPTAPVTRAMP